MGLREELLALSDLETKEIDVPSLKRTKELGNPIRIKALNGEQRDAITNLYMVAPSEPLPGTQIKVPIEVPPHLHETIVVLGVVDEHGARVFTDEDAVHLAKNWGVAVKVIHDQILEISGMEPDAIAVAEKKFASDLSDASGSGSPENLATL